MSIDVASAVTTAEPEDIVRDAAPPSFIVAAGFALLAVVGSLAPWQVAYDYHPLYTHVWNDAILVLCCTLPSLAYLLLVLLGRFRRRWADLLTASGLALGGLLATLSMVLTEQYWDEHWATGFTDATWGVGAAIAGGFGGAAVLFGQAAGIARAEVLRKRNDRARTFAAARPWLSGAGLIVGSLGPWEIDQVPRFEWTLEAHVSGAALAEGRWVLALGTTSIVVLAWGSTSKHVLGWRLVAGACFVAATIWGVWAWATLESTTNYSFHRDLSVEPGYGLPVSIISGLLGTTSVLWHIWQIRAPSRADSRPSL